MAMTQVSINDEAKAEAWKTRAGDLNKRTKEALEHLARDLEDIQQTASGDLVRQFVDTAADVYQHTNQILEGMNGLLDVVSNVLDLFKKTIGTAFDKANDTIRKLFK